MVDKQRYHERKARGVCVLCGEQAPAPGSVKCEGCLLKKRAYKRAYDGATPHRPGGPGRAPVIPDAPGAPPGSEVRLKRALAVRLERALAVLSPSPSWPTWITRGRQRYGLPT